MTDIEKFIEVDGNWIYYSFYYSVDTPYPTKKPYEISLKFQTAVSAQNVEILLAKNKIPCSFESKKGLTKIKYKISSEIVVSDTSQVQVKLHLEKKYLQNSLGSVGLVSTSGRIHQISLRDASLFSSTLPPLQSGFNYNFPTFKLYNNLINSSDQKNLFEKDLPAYFEIGQSFKTTMIQKYSIEIKQAPIKQLGIIMRIPRKSSYQKIKTSFFPETDHITKDEDGNVFAHWALSDLAKGSKIDFVCETEIIRTPVIFYGKDYGSIQDYSKNHDDFLEETRIWDIDRVKHDQLRAILRSSDVYDVVCSIFEFVNNHVDYELHSGRRKASDTLKRKKGDCTEFSDLMVGLLRFMGIPSRLAFGRTIDRETYKLEAHAWVEFMTPDETWYAVDPTWGVLGGIGATHILEGYDDGEMNTSISQVVQSSFSFLEDRGEPRLKAEYKAYLLEMEK